MNVSFNVERGSESYPFFCLIFFYYLSNMEHLTKAELYGKVLELQDENQKLKKQSAIQNGIYYGQDTTLHH
jgi:hypothetical protein